MTDSKGRANCLTCIPGDLQAGVGVKGGEGVCELSSSNVGQTFFIKVISSGGDKLNSQLMAYDAHLQGMTRFRPALHTRLQTSVPCESAETSLTTAHERKSTCLAISDWLNVPLRPQSPTDKNRTGANDLMVIDTAPLLVRVQPPRRRRHQIAQRVRTEATEANTTRRARGRPHGSAGSVDT